MYKQENIQAQKIELSSLKQKYDSKILISKNESNYFGVVTIDVEVPKGYLITYKEQDEMQSFELDFLPPIELKFELFPNYPFKDLPHFVIKCSWLTAPQMADLCFELREIYYGNRGHTCLDKWTTFLSKNVLEYLRIQDMADITEIMEFKAIFYNHVEKDLQHENRKSGKLTCLPKNRGKQKYFNEQGLIDFECPRNLPTYLKDFNSDYKKNIFNSQLHTCNVCFMDKKGSEFFEFYHCGHNFCYDCTRDYFTIQIKEGNVKDLNCMNESCLTAALPAQVLNLVPQELFQRYDTLLLSSALGTMDDVTYCPQKRCQFAVIVEPNSLIAICPQCKHEFCNRCKSPSHGTNPCKIRKEELRQVLQVFKEGSSSDQKRLEKKYGKEKLKSLLEEGLSEFWVKTNSKPCPKCNTSIEKIDGCHKMTCRNCGYFFCWLCMALLDKKNPYLHFSDTNSSCYDKLFLNVIHDDEDELEQVQQYEDENFGMFL